MFLGQVIGSLVATIKYEGLEGVKLLWVQPIYSDGSPSGKALVACDATQAGVGERVYLVDGREAALALPRNFVPVDATIVGIVEFLDGNIPDRAAPLPVSQPNGVAQPDGAGQ